jgi:hypothetical protein
MAKSRDAEEQTIPALKQLEAVRNTAAETKI